MRESKKKYRPRIGPGVAVVLAVAMFAIGLGCYGLWQRSKAVMSGSGPPVSADLDDTAGGEGGDGAGTAPGTVIYEGKTYLYNDKLSNFLFMGIDTRAMDSAASAGQADAIFLLSWNRGNNDVTLITIPRDTMTEIEVFSAGGKSLGTTQDHINLAYAYGDGKHKSCALMKTAVSRLFYGLPIQGYCSIGMDGITILAGMVDGVEVTLPDDSPAGIHPEWTQGAVITLDEDNVEAFVRSRDTGEDLSAMDRLERQKVFINAWSVKAQAMYEKDAAFVTRIYEALEPVMVTSMGNDQFVKLMEAFSAGGDTDSWMLPGESVVGDNYDEYHVDDSALYKKILETFYVEAG